MINLIAIYMPIGPGPLAELVCRARLLEVTLKPTYRVPPNLIVSDTPTCIRGTFLKSNPLS